MMHEAKLSKTKNHFNENKKKKIKDPDNKTERSNLGKLIMIPVPETWPVHPMKGWKHLVSAQKLPALT
jgi:hypothetical protein